MSAVMFALFWLATALANHCTITPPDTDGDMLGPFYIKDTPFKGDVVVPQQRMPNEVRLTVSGYILDSACRHVSCAEIEVWSTDHEGKYSFSYPFWGRGRIKADENGFYEYTTWYPAIYPGRPRHIHYMVTPPGGNSFVTQLYFANDRLSVGYPSTVTKMPQRKPFGVDYDSSFDIVLPSRYAFFQKVNACPADTGRSIGTQGAMSAAQIQANVRSGSSVFLNEPITVSVKGDDSEPSNAGGPSSVSGTLSPSPVPVSVSEPSRNVVPGCTDNNENCALYASLNLCEGNPWIQDNCRNSCGGCSASTVSLPNAPGCTDKDDNCALFASLNLCEGNWWIQDNCQNSCGGCSTGISFVPVAVAAAPTSPWWEKLVTEPPTQQWWLAQPQMPFQPAQ